MMEPEQPQVFLPPRTRGILIHAGLALFLAAAIAAALWLGLQQAIGSYFVLLVVLSVALTPPLIWVIYRGYALLRASYAIERDGLRIRWGLRSVDIPLPDVEWIRPAAESGLRLAMPILRLPGGIIGTRQVEGLGPVEYIASDIEEMLLVATPEKIYAISPAESRSFLSAFQYAIELGSLTPLPSHSALPAAYLQNVWTDRPARLMILAGFGFTAALFIFVSLLIPSLPPVSLGFEAVTGLPGEAGPPERLLLLPVLAVFTFAMDLFLGLYLYGKPGSRGVSYMLWIASSITPLLLIIATLFLVAAS